MEFDLEDFVVGPTVEKLNACTKSNLLAVAARFEVPVTKQEKKQFIKQQIHSALADKDILPSLDSGTTQVGVGAPDSEVRKLELQLEMRRVELEFELRKLELEAAERRESARMSSQQSSRFVDADFDVNKCIRLVPPFSENDVDRYFVLFERVARTLNWPEDVWPLLLQCVFIGKAQEAYASLSPEDSLKYDKVKTAVERAYELVPEAYRQKFRRYRKIEAQSYVEFGRDKAALFDRWCAAQKVETRDQLRDLILMEEFKNCLPGKIATYINEQKPTRVSAAATLADEYVLTHKESFDELVSPFSQGHPVVDVRCDEDHFGFGGSARERPLCAYCKKRGHLIDSCFLLNKKNKSKAVGLS